MVIAVEKEHKKRSISRYTLRWNTQGFVHRLDMESVGGEGGGKNQGSE